MQRKLAFIFSLIGYATALLWAILVHTSKELLMICATYFISVVILTFFNKVLKKRASGHACSFSDISGRLETYFSLPHHCNVNILVISIFTETY